MEHEMTGYSLRVRDKTAIEAPSCGMKIRQKYFVSLKIIE